MNNTGKRCLLSDFNFKQYTLFYIYWSLFQRLVFMWINETCFVFKHIGSLSLTSCKTKQIADWYTIFFNPKPDYVNTIHCTQEAVYPL